MRGNLSREAQPAVVTTVGTDPVPRSATPTPMPCDVEVAPKKTGVSLRRAKQFALVEAPSAKRIQLGLNLRGVAATERLRSMSGMCTHRVDLTSVNDVDDEVQGWLRAAYDLA